MNDKPIEVLLYPATGDKKPERRTLEPGAHIRTT